MVAWLKLGSESDEEIIQNIGISLFVVKIGNEIVTHIKWIGRVLENGNQNRMVSSGWQQYTKG